jgi:hypothetical protein
MPNTEVAAASTIPQLKLSIARPETGLLEDMLIKGF